MNAGHFGIPTGPVDTRPGGFYEFNEQATILRETLSDAGLELGQYERMLVDWLSRWDWATVAVIASWVARAAAAREAEKDTRGGDQPHEGESTPAPEPAVCATDGSGGEGQ
ncbi:MULTISPECIES: hypothetical protein [unclassified Streptomyces]|uniref:hypothetical protein n=1 Tax=unclassified Streptomyces TaxID=2593676 RepID=UPI000FFE861F|nr:MULTISPECIES: hypothetical protein [unclassified Streptomyces]